MLLFVLTPWILVNMFTSLFVPFWSSSEAQRRGGCTACGKRGADVRPDFNWDKKPVAAMGGTGLF